MKITKKKTKKAKKPVGKIHVINSRTTREEYQEARADLVSFFTKRLF